MSCVSAMRDRARSVPEDAVDPGRRLQARADSGDKLTQLEIQRWKWDFGAKPHDPNYGEMDTRFIGEVPATDRQGAGADRR